MEILEENPVMVLTVQGKPGGPHQGGAGAHINPEGGPLNLASPVGQGNTDNNKLAVVPDRPPEGEDIAGAVQGLQTG